MAFVKCRRRGEGGAEWILVFFFYISCEGIGVWSTWSASFCLHSCAVIQKCVQSIFLESIRFTVVKRLYDCFYVSKSVTFLFQSLSDLLVCMLCSCHHNQPMALSQLFFIVLMFLHWPMASVYYCIFQGLFARKRMLLLTEGPHLYYVDYSTKEKVVKGQIPWSVCCQWKYVCLTNCNSSLLFCTFSVKEQQNKMKNNYTAATKVSKDRFVFSWCVCNWAFFDTR